MRCGAVLCGGERHAEGAAWHTDSMSIRNCGMPRACTLPRERESREGEREREAHLCSQLVRQQRLLHCARRAPHRAAGRQAQPEVRAAAGAVGPAGGGGRRGVGLGLLHTHLHVWRGCHSSKPQHPHQRRRSHHSTMLSPVEHDGRALHRLHPGDAAVGRHAGVEQPLRARAWAPCRRDAPSARLRQHGSAGQEAQLQGRGGRTGAARCLQPACTRCSSRSSPQSISSPPAATGAGT